MYLDFAKLKEVVKVETAAHAMKLVLVKHGPQMRGACPACRSGGDRALAINTQKQMFYCFAAKVGGDVIALTAHIQGLAVKDAANWLGERFMNEHREQVPDKEQYQGTVPGFQPLDYLEAAHEAVEALGFDAEVARALGVGYAPKGILRGTVAVPIRLPDGTLSGYIGITDARLPSKWHGIEPSNVVRLKTA